MVIPCDFTQICRLCLVKDKVNVFLFDNNDTTKSILEKINSCLPVTVSENDNLPKKICDICLEKLNATYAFQNTTLNSEKQLLTWLAESSSKSASSINDVAIEVLPDTSIVKEEAPDPDIVNELNEELHSQIEETEEPVPKRPRRSTALNRPVIEPDTEEDEDVDDVEPISKFESEDEDLEKLDIPSYLDPTTLADQPGPSGVGKESGEPTIKETNKTFNENEIVKNKERFGVHFLSEDIDKMTNNCRYCLMNFKTREQLNSHVKIDHFKKKHECEICGKMFHKRALKFHINTHNQESKPFQCVICNKKFFYKNSLMRHKDVHSGTIFQCDVCNKICKSGNALNRHKKIRHIDPDRYKCTECEMAFPTRYHIESHLKSCHPHLIDDANRKRHLCDTCGKSLSTEANLMAHKKTHELTKKEYKCEICGGEYLQERYLKNHIKKIHKGVRNRNRKGYVCEICGKQFYNKCNYEDHLNIHKGLKPLKCLYCEKYFGSRSNLTSHIRIHTGEKPFKCPCCEKAFIQHSTLAIHKRIHSGERPYKCQYCMEAFISRTVLNTHIKRKH